jgi:hypothetical protein
MEFSRGTSVLAILILAICLVYLLIRSSLKNKTKNPTVSVFMLKK